MADLLGRCEEGAEMRPAAECSDAVTSGDCRSGAAGQRDDASRSVIADVARHKVMSVGPQAWGVLNSIACTRRESDRGSIGRKRIPLSSCTAPRRKRVTEPVHPAPPHPRQPHLDQRTCDGDLPGSPSLNDSSSSVLSSYRYEPLTGAALRCGCGASSLLRRQWSLLLLPLLFLPPYAVLCART